MRRRIDNLSDNLDISGDLYVDGTITTSGSVIADTIVANGNAFNWPTDAGSAGNSLTTNGAGVLAWTNVSGGGGGGGATDRIENVATTAAVTATSSDTVTITTAGAERMRVTAAGNVMIRAAHSVIFNQADDSAGVSIAAPSAGVATYSITLPPTQAAGALTNNGSGGLTWTAASQIATSAKYSNTNTSTNITLGTQSLVSANALSGQVIITLPAAASSMGQIIHVFKIDSSANTVEIRPASGESIDGIVNGISVLSTQNDHIQFICVSTGWFS